MLIPAALPPHTPYKAGAGFVLPGQLPQRRDHGGHLQALLGHCSRFETGRAPPRRELRDGIRQDPKLLRRRTGGCAPPRPPAAALLKFNRFVTRRERGHGGSVPGFQRPPTGTSLPQQGSPPRCSAQAGNNRAGVERIPPSRGRFPARALRGCREH